MFEWNNGKENTFPLYSDFSFFEKICTNLNLVIQNLLNELKSDLTLIC